MPVAGLAATAVAGPSLGGLLIPEVLLGRLGLALLVPVVPFALKLITLRRLNSAVFGTLMSLELAIALTVGLLFLHQLPDWVAVAGIGLVVAAGIGAEDTGGGWTGSRGMRPPGQPQLPPGRHRPRADAAEKRAA